MATSDGKGRGTREKPWILKTPSGQSEFQAFRDDMLDPPALVVMVGKTEVRYHMRCLADLHAMLKAHESTEGRQTMTLSGSWCFPARSLRPKLSWRRTSLRPLQRSRTRIARCEGSSTKNEALALGYE